MSIKDIICTYKQPLVMAFGNPLLDTIVINESDNLTPLLKSLKLNIDGEAEIEEDHMEELLEDIPKDSRKLVVAGGSALNSMRFLQKLCNDKSNRKLCAFYGGIGKDKYGDTLRKLIEDSHIDARFAVDPSFPTGAAVAIITGQNRSLAANIGAAGRYAMEHLEAERLPLETTKILYIEGFFVSHSFDVCKKVISKVQDFNIAVAFNLSGEYLFKDHHKQIIEISSISKIIFGNVREMTALARSLTIPTDDPLKIPFYLNQTFNVSVNVAEKCSPHWLVNGCVIVMSQGGGNPAIVVWGSGESHQVIPYEPRQPVRDTTGAGDALVAGFLAGVLAGQSPATCLEWGCKVAAEVVTQLGATLPDDLPNDFLKPLPTNYSSGSAYRRH